MGIPCQTRRGPKTTEKKLATRMRHSNSTVEFHHWRRMFRVVTNDLQVKKRKYCREFWRQNSEDAAESFLCQQSQVVRGRSSKCGNNHAEVAVRSEQQT